MRRTLQCRCQKLSSQQIGSKTGQDHDRVRVGVQAALCLHLTTNAGCVVASDGRLTHATVHWLLAQGWPDARSSGAARRGDRAGRGTLSPEHVADARRVQQHSVGAAVKTWADHLTNVLQLYAKTRMPQCTLWTERFVCFQHLVLPIACFWRFVAALKYGYIPLQHACD